MCEVTFWQLPCQKKTSKFHVGGVQRWAREIVLKQIIGNFSQTGFKTPNKQIARKGRFEPFFMCLNLLSFFHTCPPPHLHVFFVLWGTHMVCVPFFFTFHHHHFPRPSPQPSTMSRLRLFFSVLLALLSSGAGQKAQLRVAFAYFSAVSARGPLFRRKTKTQFKMWPQYFKEERMLQTQPNLSIPIRAPRKANSWCNGPSWIGVIVELFQWNCTQHGSFFLSRFLSRFEVSNVWPWTLSCVHGI